MGFNEPLDVIEYKGYKIKVFGDDDAPNPATEFDNYSPAEVEAWRNGETFGYLIEDPDGVEIDCCWGFYGWSSIDSPKGWVRLQCQGIIDLARNAAAQQQSEIRDLELAELGARR